MNALGFARLIMEQMSSEELKVARNMLMAFETRGEKGPNKSVALFDILMRENKSGNETTESHLSRMLYGKATDYAFTRLVLRLKEKLLESLVLNININRADAYSERGKTLHLIRRELSQAQILQHKGLRDLALDMANDIALKAIKFEHYEECIGAVRICLQLQSLNKGNKSATTDRLLYTKALKALSALKKADEYYSNLIGSTEFAANGNSPVFFNKLNAQIVELQEEYKETGSANVAFLLNYLEIHHLQLQWRYKAAAKVLNEQVSIVEHHPALYSPARLAGALINQAWNELYLLKFNTAIAILEKAEKKIPGKHFNYFQAFETRFYGYFYLAEYKNALDCIELLDRIDNGSTSEYRLGKRDFRKANIYFLTQEYEKAKEILRQLNPIEDDQDGWNVGLRFLSIMNDIALEHIENAVLKIENLRKQLTRLKKNDLGYNRDWLKYEILKNLVSTRFSFPETYRKCRTEMEQLKSKNKETSWKILSAELIPFELWFESKVFKTEIDFKQISYTEPLTVNQ